MASAPSLGRGWAITVVATATMAVSYLDRQVLGVLAPSVREELEIGNEAYGWIAAAFSYAYLVATPIAGRLLERLGVRRGLVAAVLVLLDAGALTFGFLAGRHASRHGPERSPVLLACVAIGLVASLALLPLTPDPWSATLVFGVAMAGGGGVFAILTADLVTGVGPSLAASAGGITAAAQSVAYIVASPLIGRAVEATERYDVAAIGVGLWLVPGALTWIAMRPRVAA